MSETSVTQTNPAEIDQRLFRDVLGHYPTGVVAVTGADKDGNPMGMILGTFSSVSLEPPLVSFMPTKSSQTYAQLRDAESFCINVLAHDQQNVTRTLSQRDPSKFDRVEWSMSEYGAPKIEGAVAHIHGRLNKEIEAGDHLIVLCDVHDIEISRPVTPLLFFQGGYGGFSPVGLAAYVDADLISAVRLAERTRPQLAELADKLKCTVSALILINDHDQTIGASAYGGRTVVNERLGVRIPLYPPLGEAAVAWNETYADRWLARIFPQDPEIIASYQDRLAQVRENGYAVSFVPQGKAAEFKVLSEALHEYSLGQLTPARDRAVKTTFAQSSEFFGIEAPADAESIASIVVPVFEPESQNPSGLVLRVGNLPKTTAPADVAVIAQTAIETANKITALLAGEGILDFERYVASGLRDKN